MTKVDFKTIKIEELADLVSKELNNNNIIAVLVGGACVSIYTKNKYQSLDLDYVSPDSTEKIEKVLIRLGFIREGKFRHYVNSKCPFYIEFPPGPVAIGKEFPITKFSKIGSIVLLNATDCVKDRLAAFFHWNDEQSLEQSLLVANAQKVDLAEIKRWAINEQEEEKYNRFIYLLKRKIK
ncbi:MAG: hypothetical protein ABII74_02620 [Elusimicrobiota bacterium]